MTALGVKLYTPRAYLLKPSAPPLTLSTNFRRLVHTLVDQFEISKNLTLRAETVISLHHLGEVSSTEGLIRVERLGEYELLVRPVIPIVIAVNGDEAIDFLSLVRLCKDGPLV